MSYSPIIAAADLGNIIYQEIIAEITRDTPAITDQAILIGIGEVKMYLTRYDLVKLFGDPVANTSATFSDPYLTQLCKYVCLWHLIQLANPNINYEAVEKLYTQSIASLKRIQKEEASPQWPYATKAEANAPSYAGTIRSQPLRNTSGIPDSINPQ